MTAQDIYNLPNLVSLIRLLMAPVLLVLAILQQPEWFIWLLMFTVFTDVLDGFLARTLNQITEMGSHLDSWGDFAVYFVMAVAALLLWPQIVFREVISFVVIVMSFTVPVIIGLIKFKTITSYHTWSVKLAVGLTIISYILLFSEIASWPFQVSAFMCAYAAIEEILISLILKHEQVDVRTMWHAMKHSRD